MAKDKGKASAERVPLVVTSKVKAFIKEQGCLTSSDAVNSLNDKIYKLLEEAVARTKGNKRSTLRPQDL